jgi:hypothetical protein
MARPKFMIAGPFSSPSAAIGFLPLLRKIPSKTRAYADQAVRGGRDLGEIGTLKGRLERSILIVRTIGRHRGWHLRGHQQVLVGA